MSGIKYIKTTKIQPKASATIEMNRKCNICGEPILGEKSSIYTNRDAGYGLIGRAHDSCIAKRLSKQSS